MKLEMLLKTASRLSMFLIVTIGIIIVTGVLIDTYEFFKSRGKDD